MTKSKSNRSSKGGKLRKISHRHRYTMIAGVSDYYQCVICYHKRQLKQTKIALIKMVLAIKGDDYFADTVGISEKSLLKILEDPNMTRSTHKTNQNISSGNCYYCKRIAVLTKDHVIPRSHGGTKKNNIVKACKTCNLEKGNLSLSDWYLKLQKKGDIRANVVKALMSSSISSTDTAQVENNAIIIDENDNDDHDHDRDDNQSECNSTEVPSLINDDDQSDCDSTEMPSLINDDELTY